jgi:hypothetical protein
MIQQLPNTIASSVYLCQRLRCSQVIQHILHINANPAFALLQVIQQSNDLINFSHAISFVNSNLHPVGIIVKKREQLKV